MSIVPTRALLAALLLSLGIFSAWIVTGTRSYTTMTVLTIVDTPPDSDDPLAGTGFYDDAPVHTVREDSGFRLGLLPTPSGIFDPHALSVLTLLLLAWAPFALLLGRSLWRARHGTESSPDLNAMSSTRSR